MQNIKKIDIHAHVTAFPEYQPQNKDGSHFITPEELIEIYDSLNIEKGIILPLSSPEAMLTPLTSECAKYVVDRYPDRFAWFCSIDPRAVSYSENADLSVLFEHYKAMGAKGVGEVTSPLYADDPMVENLIAAAAHYDMPVIFHISARFGGTYGIVDDLGLPRIEKMLKKYPNFKLIGHSQPFWSEISSDVTERTRTGDPKGKITEGRVIELLRECPNLYCDLSAGSGMNAVTRDPEYTAEFFEEFSDRILYGCDITALACKHQYRLNDFLNGMVADGALSEENYKKIVRENAIRLLGDL